MVNVGKYTIHGSYGLRYLGTGPIPQVFAPWSRQLGVRFPPTNATWRIGPHDVTYVVNDHGDRFRPLSRATWDPLPNGLFMAYK